MPTHLTPAFSDIHKSSCITSDETLLFVFILLHPVRRLRLVPSCLMVGCGCDGYICHSHAYYRSNSFMTAVIFGVCSYFRLDRFGRWLHSLLTAQRDFPGGAAAQDVHPPSSLRNSVRIQGEYPDEQSACEVRIYHRPISDKRCALEFSCPFRYIYHYVQSRLSPYILHVRAMTTLAYASNPPTSDVSAIDPYESDTKTDADAHAGYDKQQSNTNENENESNPIIELKPSIPWRYKLTAFAFIVLWGTGSTLAEHTLGPLKSTIVRELKVTSECLGFTLLDGAEPPDAQFGAISSSSSFINSVLPILGGIGMDYFGASK